MQKTIVFILSICFSATLMAQVGIRSYYQNINAPNWERLDREGAVLGDTVMYQPLSIGIGLDYWFRLGDYRVEFFPEVGYIQMSSFQVDSNRLQWDQWFARVNTHFYVFDFEEDCDCPTFSKQSPWLKKGFFFSLSAGAAYAQYDRIVTPDLRHSNVNFTASIGLGLDIGINDFITLTPNIQWAHWFTPEWQGLAAGEVMDLERSHATAVQFGLRLGLRFDQLFYYY